MKHKVKNVFIAGATGLIGYHTALAFLDKGVHVEGITLPNELESFGWFPYKARLHFGNLFQMSDHDILSIFRLNDFDTLIYALGPDDRVIPNIPAYRFFYNKLVIEAKRVCKLAKSVGVKRCIVMNSYFAYFDKEMNGVLSMHHPYIHARVEQQKEIFELGVTDQFDVMMMELPYIFGTMPYRKPLWKDYFLSHFDNSKKVYFPKGGGTAVIDIIDVAKAIVAVAYNGENGKAYFIGEENMTFKELIELMLEAKGSHKQYKEVSPRLAALGARKLDKLNYKNGKESGLSYSKLMTDIQSKKFYIPSQQYKIDLDYEELDYLHPEDVRKSIVRTIKKCYE